MQKLVTIGIPTYNRKINIYKQVSILFDFIIRNSFEEEIELLIIDNNSHYEIFDILKQFLNKKKNFFKVKKNSKNLGMTNNIIETMKLSSAKYYYFIGDDNEINLNSFKKVINIIKENKNIADVIITGNKTVKGYENLFKNIKEGHSKVKKNILSIVPIYYIGNANTFTSTKYLNELLTENKLYLLNSYPIPHSALTIYNLKKCDKALLINIRLLGLASDIDNNVVTSWSMINTRFYFSYLLDRNFKLSNKNFLERHGIKKLHFFKFLISLSIVYHFQDNKAEQNDFDNFLKKTNISIFFKLLFRFFSSKLILISFFFIIFIKNLTLKKKIITIKELRQLYLKEKKNKLSKKGTHYWNSNFTF